MIITKNKHIKTISKLTVMHQTQLAEINEIIEDQEKQIEALVDKVADMIKRVENAKTSAIEVLDLLDYSSEDNVIPSIVNFLNEQGNAKAAKSIGKCKLGQVSIKQGKLSNKVIIPIFCTGSAYNILFKNDNNETKQIQEAFETFYSKYYIDNFTKLRYFRHTSISLLHHSLELTVKHIEPKESDLELFLEKVEKLKKLVSKK
mgnify:CR=1 FL=1